MGGDPILDTAIVRLKDKLAPYGLSEAKLEVHQGFSYLSGIGNPGEKNDREAEINTIVKAKDAAVQLLQARLDSVESDKQLGKQLFAEIKTQYNDLLETSIGTGNTMLNDSTVQTNLLVIVRFSKSKSHAETARLENWLKIRLQPRRVKLVL